MSFVFLGLALLMLVAATGCIALPLRKQPRLLATPLPLLTAFVPLSAIGLYALLGSPAAITAESSRTPPTPHTPVSADPGQSKRSYGSVASLIDGLRNRLENEPDDAGGWLLLAKSYQHLDRDGEAARAYERAKALGKSDLEFEATLLGPMLADSPRQALSGPALRGRVSLSAEAAARTHPDDTVFIFAKETRQHRMTVVALPTRDADLPLDFVLTEKEMMVPDASLDDFAELVVTAKISRSGNASDSSQGLQAWSSPVSPQSAAAVQLVIDLASRQGSNSHE